MDADPEVRMAEWLEKLKAIGYEKYVNDMQSQLEEYQKRIGN
jgi:hypothetical protein